MRSPRLIMLGFLILILICGCSPSVPANTPTLVISSPVGAKSPTTTPEPPAPEIALVRIRLATTSDWTTLSLVAGATWLEHDLISASDEVTTAEIYDNHFVLGQPINRAEDSGSVEMITETLFSLLDSGRPLVFLIERGHIGSTTLDLSLFVEDEWVVVKTINWGDIAGDGANEFRVEIPPEQLFGEIDFASAPNWQMTDIEPVDPVTGMPQGTDGFAWWNDTIFYEIYVRSFSDSDGDGIGDLNGITQKLDYLNDGDPATTTDLGITGIWLMPIYSSPTVHGYNVTDFKGVNPQYGTLDDLKNLIDAAHQRGIRIILDFMVGQSSNQHPWFINARNPASPYRDWYIWEDDNPGYAGSWGQPVWFEHNGSYFYSTYSEYSPDLNLNNPEVNQEIREAIRFWLEDVGVDGFRLDSAKHVIEEGEIQANSAATHAWWKDFRPFYKEINPQAVTVGEIWEHTSINAEYLQGDEFDLSFEFSLAYEIVKAINEENADIVSEQVGLSYSSIPPLQFSTFLTNHDQDRLMDQLGYSTEKNKAAASILLTAPGVPFLYYGEEVGLQGEGLGNTRRPMQWSPDQFAGFTTGTPWQPLGFDWEYFNVANQNDNQASMLSHYRSLIQARNQHVALRVGDLSVVITGNDALYSIIRVSQEEAVLVLINLTGEPVMDYRLTMEDSSLAEGNYTPVAILGKGEFAPLLANSSGGFFQYVPIPEVPPYATFILQIQRDVPE